MLKILINAYACSPNMGSEPGMAWNWCIHLAKHCELHIITEGEFREQIEVELSKLPQGVNMHFYYNPVSELVRKMCWNQGDWRFYKYYKQWQWKTYQMALEIIRTQKIEIFHQLNMIGFREPGYLWKIKDIPFVWGPIGGLKQFPLTYIKHESFKNQFVYRLKNILNIFQLRYDYRVNKALNKAAALISSIPDSYNAIKKYKYLESTIIPETGCFENIEMSEINRNFDDEVLKIMWVGKFDLRKQLSIAIQAVAQTMNKHIQLEIFGKGSTVQEQTYRSLAKEINVEKQLIWHGSQPNSKILAAMKSAHLFFFSSISDDTSTVVLEAITSNLPVLCFDACGFGYVVNEEVGIKIPLTNPQQSIKDFATKIDYLYHNRHILKEMSENCKERQQELSWDRKAEKMVQLYKRVLEN